MMNKMFKKVSAVALAAAMTLGSSVAAQAATVKIYFREWHQNSTSNSYLGTPDTSTFGREPVFTVNNVKKGTTYKAVLDEAVKNSDDDYVLTWTGTDGDYLKTITIGNKPWDKTGKNTEPDYDGDTMIGAIWVGSAWMWYEGDNIDLADTHSYPETTLGKTYVPVVSNGDENEVYSFVLSYDETKFGWGTKE